jgi:uncharacterized protein
MRVAITGSTGLLGSALRDSLEEDGHTVVPLVRERDEATGDAVYWSPARGEVDADALAGTDVVVHLAGEPIRARRWGSAYRRRVRESRVQGTRLLAEALAGLREPPALVSASATGYYGDRGDEELTEESPPGDTFMAELCVAWEQATAPAEDAGLRVVWIRNGVVLARGGELLRNMVPPFKLGLGGPVGRGRQWVPWIGAEDHVQAVRFLIDRNDLSGPFNLTSPEPVRNKELAQALGDVLRRPSLLPVPPAAIRILFGDVAMSLAVESQRALPRRLLESGFEFHQPDVRDALGAALAG